MNKITLKGIIRDIEYSHTINDVEYNQANLICSRADGKEDIISLKFKKFSNKYREGDKAELLGNIRSYSQKISDTKNKVSLYVFTYFDTPSTNDEFEDFTNKVELDGRICKIDDLRTTSAGKENIHLVIANNIISNDGKQKLNNYIPSVCWGKLAILASTLHVNDKISVIGELHSRVYKKILDNGEMELRTAHELVISSLEKIDEI